MNHKSDEVLGKVAEFYQDELYLEAEALVKEQLAADPDNLALMTKLGAIQARLCNDHEAESTFRVVLVRDPNHEDAVCGLGRLLDQSLRTEEAEQIYRDFIQNNPIGHCALEDLCRLLLSEDRTDEALDLARNQVEQFGSHLNAFDALRYVLHILEDQLESELNDDRGNETIFVYLLDNLYEQLDLVITMEGGFELQEELRIALDDDKTRLISEIEHLLESAVNRQISVPEELHNRILSYKKQV